MDDLRIPHSGGLRPLFQGISVRNCIKAFLCLLAFMSFLQVEWPMLMCLQLFAGRGEYWSRWNRSCHFHRLWVFAILGALLGF
jgi:hypothetical protein